MNRHAAMLSWLGGARPQELLEGVRDAWVHMSPGEKAWVLFLLPMLQH
jgi:hypothetical protein